MRTYEAAIQAAVASEEANVFTSASPPFPIVEVNWAWELVCGFKRADVLGKSCKVIQGAETCRRTLHVLHEALRERRPVSVRLLNYTSGGVPFVNDLSVEPLVSEGAAGVADDAANVTHFVGTLCAWRPPSVTGDFNRLFATPGEHRELLELRDSLPQCVEQAVLISDRVQVITDRRPPFNIFHVSAAWCEACGFSASEMVGKTCGMLQGPETCRSTLGALRQAAKAGQSISVRLLNFRKAQPPTP